MSNVGVRAGVILFVLWIGSGTSLADASAPTGIVPGAAWRRTPFVIGAPGRLDADGDRRNPRFYQRADSAVAAYADIDEVLDQTWLRHEIEGYARRAVDCVGLGREWCRRAVDRVGAAQVISIASGAHAELVWPSGGNRAVRLGWRRIVATPTGTMTLDAPPADFAAAVLAAFPSQLAPFAFDGAHDRAWTEEEVDRLLYYVDQVVAGLPAVATDQHRLHAVRFVEAGLAQITQLRTLQLGAADPAEPTWWWAAVGPAQATGALPPRLAEQLDAVRAWRSDDVARQWCAAQLASSAAPSLTANSSIRSP